MGDQVLESCWSGSRRPFDNGTEAARPNLGGNGREACVMSGRPVTYQVLFGEMGCDAGNCFLLPFSVNMGADLISTLHMILGGTRGVSLGLASNGIYICQGHLVVEFFLGARSRFSMCIIGHRRWIPSHVNEFDGVFNRSGYPSSPRPQPCTDEVQSSVALLLVDVLMYCVPTSF